MKYIFIIIILILILAIIIAIYCGYRHLRQKVREFSRALWGTDDITKAAKKLKTEYSTTPKSVSAMTSLLLPEIVEDFPSFNYDEMKERAENVLVGYLRGVSEQKVSLLTDCNTELKQQLEDHIQMNKARGLWEHFEQIQIHRTEISQYRKEDGRCSIILQSAIECFHYITDEESNIKDGSKEYKYQTKYNIDLIYVQDRNIVENDLDHGLGLNCPNCGAPISTLGHKYCEYCGTPVIEYNINVWTFSNIEEKN